MSTTMIFFATFSIFVFGALIAKALYRLQSNFKAASEFNGDVPIFSIDVFDDEGQQMMQVFRYAATDNTLNSGCGAVNEPMSCDSKEQAIQQAQSMGYKVFGSWVDSPNNSSISARPI